MKIKKITAGILAMVMTLAYFCMGVSAKTLEDRLLSVSYGSSTNSTISPIQRYVKNGKVYLTMDLSEAMKLRNKKPCSIFDDGCFDIYGGLDLGKRYNFLLEIELDDPPSWAYHVRVYDALFLNSDCSFNLSSDGKFEFSASLSSDIGQLVAKETDFKIQAYVYKYGSDEETYFYGSSLDYDEYYLEAPLESDNSYTSPITCAKIKNQVYTGKPITPGVQIKHGEKGLKEGSQGDYTLYYYDNTDIGTAHVVVSGLNAHYSSYYKDSKEYKDYVEYYNNIAPELEGRKTLTFKIVPAKTTLTATRNGSKAALSWKSVKSAENYEIYYRKQGTNKYKKLTTVSSEKTSCSISKLDKNSSYEFKVRSYATRDGEKYYSSYSNVVSVK